MAKTFKIRPAEREDFESIRALLRESDLPTQGVERQLIESYVVAQHGIKVVGVCGVERQGPYGLLRSVAVSPSWRARGVGRAMVTDRIAWAENEGLRELYLLTTDADRYFKKLGFSRANREDAPSDIKGSSEFSSLCPDTAVVMVMSLCDQGEDR